MHVVRRVAVLVVLLVVIAAAVMALTSRPGLQRSRDDVNAAWDSLRSPLVARYQKLESATSAVRTVPGPVHDLVPDLDDGLRRWKSLPVGASVAAHVSAANELEALGRRLIIVAGTSPRLQAAADAKAAVDAWKVAPIPAQAGAYNRAVAKYEHERSGSTRRVVASVLGFKAIPALDAQASP